MLLSNPAFTPMADYAFSCSASCDIAIADKIGMLGKTPEDSSSVSLIQLTYQPCYLMTVLWQR